MREKIIRAMKRKGYKVFSSGRWNLNIVGVRSAISVPNSFDDRLYVFFRDHSDEWQQLCFQITCDPGHYHLQNPSRVAGTAVLKEGQYRGAYAIDKHRGRYDALCQRLGKVSVYRDADRDAVVEMDPDSVEEGFWGINIHKSGKISSTQVDRWSAGCQVFSHSHEFDVFMSLCRLSEKMYGNSFTYTLLNEQELR